MIANNENKSITKENQAENYDELHFKNDSRIRKILRSDAGITVSNTSTEFVLHVKNEYDYRYSSPQKRNAIFKVITKAYSQNMPNQPLAFYFKTQINLREFTTTDDDMKAKINRMPKDKPTYINEQAMKKKAEADQKKVEKIIKETEVVFAKTAEFQKKVTINDFNILKVLGRGAFGKVMLVEKNDTKKVYALKSLRKEDIIDKEQIDHIKTERYVLERSNSPFLTNLEYAFQTPDKIFFVMTFMRGGELFHHLKKVKRFDENSVRFYAAELVLAFEHLHNMNVVYRDLKPENILFDGDGHICLADFGMAKILEKGQLTKSFVGTPEYLAPEIIDYRGHSKCADWWSLGILIYEMIMGIPPFFNRDQNQAIVFKMIQEQKPTFNDNISISKEGKDIINRLLDKNPETRLGSNDASEVKAHPWFQTIDWKALSQKKIKPPFKPNTTNEHDVNNFDEEFTQEDAINSVIEPYNPELLNENQHEFKGFSYMPNSLLANSRNQIINISKND